MPALIVVLDSNVYRGLSPADFRHVRERESQLSVHAFASYYVTAELLAHLADSADPHFNESYSGLRRLWEHTTVFTGRHHETHMVAPVNEQLGSILFPDTYKPEPERPLGGIVGAVANTPRSELPGAFASNLRGFAETIAQSQAEFADLLWRNIVKKLAPEADNWHAVTKKSELRTQLLEDARSERVLDLIAVGIARRTARHCHVEFPDDPAEQRKVASVLRKHVPTTVYFYALLVERILSGGIDMTRPDRANSLWDWHITCSTAADGNYDGSPLWLVTNDGEMLDAAEAAGSRAFIVTKSEYLDALALDWVRFRGHVDRGPVEQPG